MRLFEGTEFDVPPRCERCQKLEVDCQCGPPPAVRKPAGEQTATIATEKRKRGKLVTVVRGLVEPDSDLGELVTLLKDFCGTGGTIKDNVIELQGDQQERATAKLSELGYVVKQS